MRLKFIRLDRRPLVVWLACLMGAILSCPSMAVAETVNLPLTIDYPLLRSLAVATAFTDPGESAIVVDENQGCRRITLSAPNYRAEGSHLKFEVKAEISDGLPCFCFSSQNKKQILPYPRARSKSSTIGQFFKP